MDFELLGLRMSITEIRYLLRDAQQRLKQRRWEGRTSRWRDSVKVPIENENDEILDGDLSVMLSME